LRWGSGLGTLVEQGGGPAGLQGASYLQFVATGLLAASAMQIAAERLLVPGHGGHEVAQDLPRSARHPDQAA
jgi:hypothetical protein